MAFQCIVYGKDVNRLGWVVPLRKQGVVRILPLFCARICTVYYLHNDAERGSLFSNSILHNRDGW